MKDTNNNNQSNLDKEDFEYIVKPEIIIEGERDTVLTRYNYGDEIIYRVEFWNEDRTGFAFATEFDTFEDAFKKFKFIQLNDNIEQIDESLKQYLDTFDIIAEGKNDSFLFKQSCRQYNFYIVGFWGERRISVHDEKEFEDDFEGAYEYFKSLQ